VSKRKIKDPKWELAFVTRADAKRYLANKEARAINAIVKDGHWYKVELLDVNDCWECGRRHVKDLARTVAENERTAALKAIFYARGSAGESTDDFALMLLRDGKPA